MKHKALIVAIIAILTTRPLTYSSGQALLALSKADHTLAIVDPSSLNILGKVRVGSDPHEVVASSDGKTAYVSIYGGGSLHEINVIDIVNRKALPTIDTRPLFGPHGIVFVDGNVWFSAEGSKAVGRYNPESKALDWSMGTGQDRTHMIYVTADTKRIYTTNVSSGTVSILVDTLVQGFGPPPTPTPGGNQPGVPGGPPPGGTREQWSQTVIPAARGCEGFDVSPDGKELWTAASDDGTLWIIDPIRRKSIITIDAKAMGANRLVFTPDGKQVFISSLRMGDVLVYDAQSRKEIRRIPVGHGASGILMDPNATRAFVACSPDNYIAIIDLKTLEVTGHLDVGGNPDGLAWAGKVKSEK